MKVRGLDKPDVRRALESANRNYGGNLTFSRAPEQYGNFVIFTLRVTDSSGPGAQRSESGRKTVSACWHAHRDLMNAIFWRAPDAILVTALARYEGALDFVEKFEATRDALGNVSCDCGE